MGRWVLLAVAAAWLAVVAIWLFSGSPRGGGTSVQAQLWGGRPAQPGIAARPGASGCVIEQIDPRHASATSCLSCHDGTAGPALPFRRGVHDPGTSHPVDVDYFTAYAQAPTKYVHPGALPPDVPLVEGKVACTSCHDPASRAPNHLARPTALCNACHNM